MNISHARALVALAEEWFGDDAETVAIVTGHKHIELRPEQGNISIEFARYEGFWSGHVWRDVDTLVASADHPHLLGAIHALRRNAP